MCTTILLPATKQYWRKASGPSAYIPLLLLFHRLHPHLKFKNSPKLFKFLFIPCGRLSWLPVSFLLHVKYPLSYRIVIKILKICFPQFFAYWHTDHVCQVSQKSNKTVEVAIWKSLTTFTQTDIHISITDTISSAAELKICKRWITVITKNHHNRVHFSRRLCSSCVSSWL